jgi:phosphoribosylformylglycinamidine synthase
LGVEPGNCVFLQGIREVELPVAHAEGKFVVRDEEVFRTMQNTRRLVLRYKTDEHRLSASDPIGHRYIGWESQVPYPANPNGSMGDVAGLCDETGRVLGLMPHPERFVDPTQHPQWTRRPAGEAGDVLRVFQNAVRYFM